jgi:hypothetical protein
VEEPVTPPESDITLGELARNMAQMERRLDARFVGLDARFDKLQFVSREVYEVQIKQLVDEVEALKEAKKWTVRTFVAAFMFPVLVAATVALVVSR